MSQQSDSSSDNGYQKTQLQIDVKYFLIALRQVGRTASTIEKYEWHLNRTLGWLAERGVVRLEDLTRPLLREWGAGLYELKCRVDPKSRKDNEEDTKFKEWAPATIKQATSVTRSFLAWCYTERLITEDLASALQVPKTKKRIQRTLTGEEVQILIDACDDTPLGVRNAALITLLVDSGLRSFEVRRLTAKDIRFDVKIGDKYVNQISALGKGGDEESTFFGKETAERLLAWLEVHPHAPNVETVFISLRGTTPGKPFTRNGLRLSLYKFGKEAGVDNVSPHAFQRTFACLADEAGASTRKIQSWGRWSDIKMVEDYTKGFKRAKQYNEYSPVDYLKRLADEDDSDEDSKGDLEEESGEA